MKQGIKYTIVFIIFLAIMIAIFTVYSNRYDKVKYLNGGTSLLKQLYELETGNYKYENGKIYGVNEIYSADSYYFDGEGNIEIDKYGNVRFYIDTDGFCVYKNYVGDINFTKTKCNKFYSVDIELIKNNNKISFTSLDNNLEYKISTKDDFMGEWIKEEYNGNIIINSYFDGKNYIWFKNSDGNISDVVEFNVDCLNANGATYNKEVFYCSGSIVSVDGIEWVVVNDSSDEITLMTKKSLENKMSHCSSEISEFCYYDSKITYAYKWSSSLVNYYLNNTFINELSEDTKSNLVTKYVCDEYMNMTCDDGNCGGYSKETINHNNWSCTDYTPSNVRLISFDEYNHLYSKLGDNSLIKGTYLMINSLTMNKASIVDTDYSVYINEDIINVNKIRPVITLKK